MKVTLITETGVWLALRLRESVKLSITQLIIKIMDFSSYLLDNSGKLVSIQIKRQSSATVLFGHSHANEATPAALSKFKCFISQKIHKHCMYT